MDCLDQAQAQIEPNGRLLAWVSKNSMGLARKPKITLSTLTNSTQPKVQWSKTAVEDTPVTNIPRCAPLPDTCQQVSSLSLLQAQLLQSHKPLGGLKVIPREIPDDAWCQYKDFIQRLESPLNEILRNSQSERHQVTFRLKSLGDSEQNARPVVVILCSLAIRGRIQHLLLNKWPKSGLDLQQDETNETILVVFGPSMRLCSNDLLLTDHDLSGVSLQIASTMGRSSRSFCGSQIAITAPASNLVRLTTIGGVIQATINDELQLFCMVAGHAIIDAAAPVSVDTQLGDLANGSTFSHFTSGLETGHLESAVNPMFGGRLSPDGPDGGASTATPEVTTDDRSWATFNATVLCPAEYRTCDWALLTLPDRSLFEGNLIYNSEVDVDFLNSRIALHSPMDRRDVILISGWGDHRRGTLCQDSTRFSMGDDLDCKTVYILELSDGAGIVQGDSGSWVVDAVTYKVYGHLIGQDMFGDGYVIPLASTFRDIAQVLGAKSVKLPNPYQLPISGISPRLPRPLAITKAFDDHEELDRWSDSGPDASESDDRFDISQLVRYRSTARAGFTSVDPSIVGFRCTNEGASRPKEQGSLARPEDVVPATAADTGVTMKHREKDTDTELEISDPIESDPGRLPRERAVTEELQDQFREYTPGFQSFSGSLQAQPVEVNYAVDPVDDNERSLSYPNKFRRMFWAVGRATKQRLPITAQQNVRTRSRPPSERLPMEKPGLIRGASPENDAGYGTEPVYYHGNNSLERPSSSSSSLGLGIQRPRVEQGTSGNTATWPTAEQEAQRGALPTQYHEPRIIDFGSDAYRRMHRQDHTRRFIGIGEIPSWSSTLNTDRQSEEPQLSPPLLRDSRAAEASARAIFEHHQSEGRRSKLSWTDPSVYRESDAARGADNDQESIPLLQLSDSSAARTSQKSIVKGSEEASVVRGILLGN